MPGYGEEVNAFRKPGASVPAYNKTRIAGQVADTEVKAGRGVVHGVMINTAGAASSKVKLFDGGVGGTPYAQIDATQVGKLFEFDAYHLSSIHVATVDSGATLDCTILWL
jgi:hypothetical protein